MHCGLFVTGTDTGVGKTILAAGILARYRSEFLLRYWKPIQTGIEEDDDTATVRQLVRCSEEEIFDQGIRLRRPVSPHLAAEFSGMTINLDALTALPGIKSNERCLIVEGAGGVLVPVTKSSTMVDLMVRLGFPVLIASRTSLGTINHTLLTIEALRARDLQIAGVALIGNPEPGARRSIEQYGQVSVIIDMPVLDPLTPKVLESWVSSAFDPDGALRQWLK